MLNLQELESFLHVPPANRDNGKDENDFERSKNVERQKTDKMIPTIQQQSSKPNLLEGEGTGLTTGVGSTTFGAGDLTGDGTGCKTGNDLGVVIGMGGEMGGDTGIGTGIGST